MNLAFVDGGGDVAKMFPAYQHPVTVQDIHQMFVARLPRLRSDVRSYAYRMFGASYGFVLVDRKRDVRDARRIVCCSIETVGLVPIEIETLITDLVPSVEKLARDAGYFAKPRLRLKASGAIEEVET